MVTQQMDISCIQRCITGSVLWFPAPTEHEKQTAFNLGAHCIQLDLENAQAFVVDAEDPQPLALWHAVLTGGVVLSKGFFSRPRHRGYCLAYTAAMQQSNVVFMARAFQEKNPSLARALKRLSQENWCKWTICDGSLEEALATCKKLVCLCRDENEKELKGGRREVLTLGDFLKKLQKNIAIAQSPATGRQSSEVETQS